MTATLSQSILWQMAIMDALWTISWVSYPRLLAIRFLWQIWHWQSCNTSALLLVFGPLTHSDIFGCSIQSTTENWSREKIDLFRDLCGLVYNRVYADMQVLTCVSGSVHVCACLQLCVKVLCMWMYVYFYKWACMSFPDFMHTWTCQHSMLVTVKAIWAFKYKCVCECVLLESCAEVVTLNSTIMGKEPLVLQISLL